MENMTYFGFVSERGGASREATSQMMLIDAPINSWKESLGDLAFTSNVQERGVVKVLGHIQFREARE